MILPTSQLACARVCMWWLAMRPVTPDRTVLSLGGCFPKNAAALPNFADNAQLYYDRWRRVAEEDVGILERRQQGVLVGIVSAWPALRGATKLAHAVHRWVFEHLPETARGDLGPTP